MCVFNTLRERVLSAGCSGGGVMDWTIPADRMRGLWHWGTRLKPAARLSSGLQPNDCNCLEIQPLAGAAPAAA